MNLSLPVFAGELGMMPPNVNRIVGRLTMIQGTVSVDTKPVTQNASVREGSVIEVKKGKATLLLGKGNVFHLDSDSKMVVNQYGIKSAESGEEGELDLKFGRTRALILNQGNEKKDLKIKARAATMGVRGTEIYIDAPKDTNKPAQFFTLEGKAEVRAAPGAPVVNVPQNSGVSASSGNNGAPPATGATSKSVAEVKEEIKTGSLSAPPVKTPQEVKPRFETQAISDVFGVGAVSPFNNDVILAKPFVPIQLSPHFCSAQTGCGP